MLFFLFLFASFVLFTISKYTAITWGGGWFRIRKPLIKSFFGWNMTIKWLCLIIKTLSIVVHTFTYIVTPFDFVYVRMRRYQTIKINIRTLSYCARIKWWAQFDFCFGDICKWNKSNAFIDSSFITSAIERKHMAPIQTTKGHINERLACLFHIQCAYLNVKYTELFSMEFLFACSSFQCCCDSNAVVVVIVQSSMLKQFLSISKNFVGKLKMPFLSMNERITTTNYHFASV